jgi:hypothetical protein
MHGEEVIGAETGVGGGETGETAEHKSRADGKKQGEGDFGDDENAAESLMSTNATAERASLERVLEIDERKAEGGNQSEKDGGE